MTDIINFRDQVIPVSDVLLKQVEDSCVLLNLKNNNYYGLDPVGHHCYSRLIEADSIQDAFERLTNEYQVEAQELKEDLIILIESLIKAEVVYLKPKER